MLEAAALEQVRSIRGPELGCREVVLKWEQLVTRQRRGHLTDSVSLLLTQLNEKDDPTALFHLQPLTALVVLFAYGLLPLTALFSSGQSQLALIHEGSQPLDLQRRYCRAQGSSWTRSILFATPKSRWLSPTVGLLRGDAVVILLSRGFSNHVLVPRSSAVS